ncbi:pimeloyl-ACP methyl ester carboxylesterase [Novosphingobium sp. SG751A]|uniref:dienelactone hydrolase family protein n=1 Tax=Novosphingobium sp. SG751A TaxID=2587000 RepID=UPI0020A636A7|nr:alpha/beta family hydrolase [Novosphingobium sp. SG751A]NOW48268.1 pimeloyl-ACP methyl ester carboxylesterase [Novosphingobium sp. SG751A]
MAIWLVTPAMLAAIPRFVSVGSGLVLEATLHVPSLARGLVIFAHGSGSARFSLYNNHVAARLRADGLATLLLDLLTTEEEEEDRRLVFNIDLLASRLRLATAWAAIQPDTCHLLPCYFGASTGAAAAFVAGADNPRIAAIVSRGGRPDLAGEEVLARVTAPSLLIVGGRDEVVTDLNLIAFKHMRCRRDIQIIPKAGQSFEELSTLNQVVTLASIWFRHHLGEKL